MHERFPPIQPGDPVNLENDFNSVRRVVQRVANFTRGDGIQGVSMPDFEVWRSGDGTAGAPATIIYGRITGSAFPKM
jgi:hypothetical protein